MANDKKNVFVYLRGNKEHGKEIIEYLESLGGTFPVGASRSSSSEKYLYFINTQGIITSINQVLSQWLLANFTEVKLDFKYQPKDKELVWCWDNNDTACRLVRFYDAKNKCAFAYDGTRYGAIYTNYAPFEGEYPNWAKEALTKLED